MEPTEKSERIAAVQHMLASIFASQKALKSLAPESNWSGLGNLLGDFGEFVAIDHYWLKKAPSGSSGYDALTTDGKTVQIKTNYAANQIGYRGDADLLLVIGVSEDGSWNEVYYGDFAIVKKQSRYSARQQTNDCDLEIEGNLNLTSVSSSLPSVAGRTTSWPPLMRTVGQLKILQEVITLTIFFPFSVMYSKEPLKSDYLCAALCLVGAVYFVFRAKLSV